MFIMTTEKPTYSVTQTSEARTNLGILAQQQLIPRRTTTHTTNRNVNFLLIPSTTAGHAKESP